MNVLGIQTGVLILQNIEECILTCVTLVKGEGLIMLQGHQINIVFLGSFQNTRGNNSAFGLPFMFIVL